MGFNLGGAISGGLSGFASGGGLGAGLGALVGGFGGGAGSGASAASKGQRQSIEESRRQFDLINKQLSPFRKAGLGGLAGVQKLLKDPSSVTSTPGYQFNLAQGQEAITGKAAAGGTLQSGATLKDLTRFGQGLATSTYQQQINNQMGLATMGAQTAVQGGQVAAGIGGDISSGLSNLGAIQGAGQIGQGKEIYQGMKDLYTVGQKSGWIT